MILPGMTECRSTREERGSTRMDDGTHRAATSQSRYDISRRKRYGSPRAEPMRLRSRSTLRILGQALLAFAKPVRSQPPAHQHLAALLASAFLASAGLRAAGGGCGRSGSRPRRLLPSRRPKSVEAKKWMIAAANPLAAKAGADVLRRGGSAADAAIAAQLVLGLVEPQSSGSRRRRLRGLVRRGVRQGDDARRPRNGAVGREADALPRTRTASR